MSDLALSASPTFLRRVLAVDAASCIGMGTLMLAGAGTISDVLGLPASLLQTAGAALIPFGLVLAWLATRPVPPRAGVIAVIVCNVVWVAESLALLVGGWIAPTGWGIAFVVAQAGAVAALTALEYIGLRAARR